MIEQLDHLDSCVLQQKQLIEEKLLNQKQAIDMLQRKQQKLENFEMNTTAIYNGIDAIITEKSECEKLTNSLVKNWEIALKQMQKDSYMLKEMTRQKRMAFEQ